MLLTLYGSLCCLILTVAAIWPKPSTHTTGQDVVWIDDSLMATFRCGGSLLFSTGTGPSYHDLTKQGSNSAPSAIYYYKTADSSTYSPVGPKGLNELRIVQSATLDTLEALKCIQFVPWKFFTRGTDFQPNISNDINVLSVIDVTQAHCPDSEGLLNPTTYFSADEAYEVWVNGTTATIHSNSTLGTLRALETFKQLFNAHTMTDMKYIANGPIYIADAPKWSHRGLSIDIARNSYSPEDIMHVVDAMAAAKMSRLHVHATDSQAWPLEIPALPDLARKGAYLPGLVWRVDDQVELQSYGASKGVSVFWEIDMPGHTASIAFAYPHLIAAFNQSDWQTFAAEPESGQLKLNSSAVTDFISNLFDDLLPRSKKYTQMHHLGGDEFNKNVYLLDETVRSNDSQVLQPLVQAFMSNVLTHVQANGLRPMVWQEMVLEWNLTLPISNGTQPSTLVQVWISSGDIEKVLKKGHRVVFGDYNNWYLDCGYGTFINPYPSGFSPSNVPFNTSGGVPTVIKNPFLDYCNPLKNWRHVFVYNPLQNISMELQHLVEGGEVLLWSEQTDPVDMDYKLWPRAAAAAEVLWAGPRNASMIQEAERRLAEWRERAVLDIGLRASPVQMTWCLMEGGCQL